MSSVVNYPWGSRYRWGAFAYCHRCRRIGTATRHEGDRRGDHALFIASLEILLRTAGWRERKGKVWCPDCRKGFHNHTARWGGKPRKPGWRYQVRPRP